MKLKRTKQPVTSLAYASSAPECLGRLTWCYVSRVMLLTTILLASSCENYRHESTGLESNFQVILCENEKFLGCVDVSEAQCRLLVSEGAKPCNPGKYLQRMVDELEAENEEIAKEHSQEFASCLSSNMTMQFHSSKFEQCSIKAFADHKEEIANRIRDT